MIYYTCTKEIERNDILATRKTKEITLTRGFEVCKGYKKNDVNLPKRSTKSSAGYDFEAVEDTVIPSIWKRVLNNIVNGQLFGDILKPTIVFTGVKAYMLEDEYLQLANRSSNPLKRKLIMTNGVGVIDSDYYSNPENDGNIGFQFWNFGFNDVEIKKGERIGQGTFLKFLKADGDDTTAERKGGFGSTDK